MRSVADSITKWREFAINGDTYHHYYNNIGVVQVNANKMKHVANLTEWKERIIACRASGLSVKEWCQQNGKTISTYYRWEREIFGHIKKQASTENPADVNEDALMLVSGKELVELPITETSNAMEVTGSPEQETFRPVAVVRMGAMEVSLTNAVSPKLMKQLKELITC